MTATQYRAAIARLGLSQRQAGTFLCVNERTSRKWASEGAPELVGKFLQFLIAVDVTPTEVDELI